jgi:hypothetical protein
MRKAIAALGLAFTGLLGIASVTCKASTPDEHTCCHNNCHTWSCCCNTDNWKFDNCNGDHPTEQECVDQGFGGSGGGTAESTGMGEGLTDPTADNSGGQMCPDEDVNYECHGWVAALYTRENDATHSNPQFFFYANWKDQTDCVHFEMATSFIGDTSPDVDEALFPMCKSLCEDMLPNYNWPDDPSGDGLWHFWKSVCVFAPNGNHGYVPDQDGVTNSPGVVPTADNGGCSNIGVVGGGADYIPQVPYVDADPGMECFLPECEGWDPPSEISWSYNTSSKTHTTHINKAFMDEVYANMGNDLYGCDNGRWEQLFIGGVETWKMQHLGIREFLYSMGFRSGDYALKIRRNVTGEPFYDLDNLEHMGDAFSALYTYASFKLEFKRPKLASPYYDLHTMNLTID